MDLFLQSIERSAYRMALFASGEREDALDLVQDAMYKFVDKYQDKPREDWKPLFYKVLHNGIRDYGRRKTVRRCLRRFGIGRAEDEGDELEKIADTKSPDPEHRAGVGQAYAALQEAIFLLPDRQRQAFLLRGWEELSVADTAKVMGCTEGSVKTHYFRAVQVLQRQLGDYWP
ncbi:MAG: RNA polymerase sigma factor [Desulforhopalus sp.]|nr:RNA polymerase sigma factor [Desulforhopalus sp.]